MKTALFLLFVAMCVVRSFGQEITFEIPAYRLTDDERSIVATCLVLEAAEHGEIGMTAVMSVIVNRAHGHPELFAQVVLRPRHFSSFDSTIHHPDRLQYLIGKAQMSPVWNIALEIVGRAGSGELDDVTGGATHYVRRGTHPFWLRRATFLCQIGTHVFYRAL